MRPCPIYLDHLCSFRTNPLQQHTRRLILPPLFPRQLCLGRYKFGLTRMVSFPSRQRHHHCLKLKVTSMLSDTSTGSPFFIPGRNRHCLSALTAFSSKPNPRPRTTRRISTEPSFFTIASRTTVPSIRPLRARSEYCGSTREITAGGVTPLPMG